MTLSIVPRDESLVMPEASMPIVPTSVNDMTNKTLLSSPLQVMPESASQLNSSIMTIEESGDEVQA